MSNATSEAGNIPLSEKTAVAAYSNDKSYFIDSVTSRDGTRIGYRRYGSGSGLILVEAAMSTAHNYDQLAKSLADNFTVIVPDRRGRGMSPHQFGLEQCLQKEMEDLESLFGQTGAEFLFGHSSGGVIALEATLHLPSVRKTVLYEPPFPVGSSRASSRFRFMPRFNREVAEGEMAAAMVTANEMVGLAPPVVSILPRPLLQLLAGAILRRDDQSHGEYAPIRTMLPAMRYDFEVVSEMQSKAENFGAVKTETLLLGGSKSPVYLKDALRKLERLLPKSKRIEFEGLDHNGPWNGDRGGHPQIVADAISKFLMEP